MPARSSGAAALVALGLLAACSKPERVPVPAEKARPHLGAEWFDFRAKTLGITAADAERRDAALSEDAPPAMALDRHTAIEAAIVFDNACASCHGKDGAPPGSLPGGGPRPREWGTFGTRMGFFFGGDSMRAGLYRKIRDGGEPRDGVASNMPAWKGSLSREQIWALVRHLESF